MADNDLEGVDLTNLDLFVDGPPHRVYEKLRNEAPLFWHEPTEHTPGGEGFWCLTRHADVEWAAKNAELFSSASGKCRDGGGTLIEDLPNGFGPGVLLNMQDAPRHHHFRRLVTPSLTPKRLRDIEAELAERCEQILDEAVEAGEVGEVDFLSAVAAELPLQAIASLLGVPQEDRHQFMEWFDAMLDHGDGRDLGEQSSASQAAGTAMFVYGTELLEQKRRCPADDIMSIIATAELPDAAEPGGPLSDLEQQMFFNLLLAAGSETTRNTITAAMLALIERPESWVRLQQDPSLLPTAVEEMLRWASSTIYNRRTATADIDLHGHTIRRGDKVVLWWQSANFDERVFTGPHDFDINRDPNPHLAFGTGSHFCLGATLARLEIRLVFAGLLHRADRVLAAGQAVRTRSNKHAGFRSAPITIERPRA
ncbi:MAG: cytochrome P450 [Actinobacteria bacterium]|nr:cytochrome P450 [Actinomycetota bacterium]